METGRRTIFWRRTDTVGLERLSLVRTADAVIAEATLICVENGGFRLDHRWALSSDWSANSVVVDKWGAGGSSRLALERDGNGWKLDGLRREDLDGADEPDLSATPFCNSFPIRRLIGEGQKSVTLDICYIDAGSMIVTRSRQQYEAIRPGVFRYVDLGLFTGFEAEIHVDEEGLVVRYEYLFEAVAAGGR
ncbi:MAG: putative glycolipid-binding domain-containing protein [Rhizobiaceae bacterium]|nr:putative glycolipid-binding domain-containing protein [Rhizobiaceae bacterium]